LENIPLKYYSCSVRIGEVRITKALVRFIWLALFSCNFSQRED